MNGVVGGRALNSDVVGGSGNAVCDHLVERAGVRDHHLGAEPAGDEVGTTVRELDGVAAALLQADGVRHVDGFREVDGNDVHVGRGKIVDDEFVDAAERAQIDALHVVEVHGDVRRCCA